jgi:hypothetical protein
MLRLVIDSAQQEQGGLGLLNRRTHVNRGFGAFRTA